MRRKSDTTGWAILRGGGGVAAVALAMWWAAAPLDPQRVAEIEPRAYEVPPRAVIAPLDLAAFSAPLWLAPPAPPESPTVAALPPLRLQLIAVVRTDDGLRAVLFDPDANRLYSLAEGESLRDGSVETVTETGMTFHDPSGTRTLSLRGGSS